jgi:hypothetical protein
MTASHFRLRFFFPLVAGCLSCATQAPTTLDPAAVAQALASDPKFISAVANALGRTAVQQPVATSKDLQDRYKPEEILAAFRSALKATGTESPDLEVDETEFPPLLFGVISGRRDGHYLREVVPAMNDPRYHHNGAMSHDVGRDRMAFSLNVVPSSEYPEAAAATIGAHLHDRLKSLVERASTKL